MANALKIEYGDDILLRLGLSAEQFSAEAKFLLAAKLYELGRLSSGESAQLCGKNRVQFLRELARIGVHPSNLGADDADAELDFAMNG